MENSESPVYRFSDVPIATDARINAQLRVCLDCNEVLKVQRTSDHGGVSLMFGQCPECRKVYILSEL